MMAKRKRSANPKSNNAVGQGAQNKRTCQRPERPSDVDPEHQSLNHPVLSLYFPKLLTLRKYLAQVLAAAKSGRGPLRKLDAVDPTSDQELCSLLDSALVGLTEDSGNASGAEKDIADATQCTPASGQPAPSQSEVVDLVLQLLFRRSYGAPRRSKRAIYPGKPNHILSLGYAVSPNGRNGIPGCRVGPFGIEVVNTYPNSHVNTLKSQLWERLLRVTGEEPMFRLLLETSIFIPLGAEGNNGTYYQLCGPPISDSLNNPVEPASTRADISNRGSSKALRKTQGHGPALNRTASEIELPAKKEPRNEASVDLPAIATANVNGSKIAAKNHDLEKERKSHGEIVFVRSRMFYARPAYNGRGEVLFGLRHIHVLNRFPSSVEHARHISKYIFPRQYGLHNVFTSEVNRQGTVQAFQDYTLREQEIHALKNKRQERDPAVPRRLKGKVLALVVKMQKLHRSCPYHALVKYYCPASLCDPGVRDKPIHPHRKSQASVASVREVQERHPPPLRTPTETETSTEVTEQLHGFPSNSVGSGGRFTEFACSSGEVSGFVKAVIGRVIPNDFFGDGATNRKILMRTVDRFVKLRRYESLSLHDAQQGLKLTDFDWLRPPSIRSDDKMSKTDESKRRQLLAEFVYWLFDSFLIPLLRAHFYITESGVDRNRIFYFRHDVWKKLSEPALDRIKGNLFQEMKGDHAQKTLAGRKLGFSQIRLLPKEVGVRPITNLRKRDTIMQNGKPRLTTSINSTMTPVFNTLSFEKSRKPEQMGSSMFSVGDMYPRIKEYQTRLAEKGGQGRKLYFAKVDVRACFDTIPQFKLLRLVRNILEEDDYRIDKYAEVRPPLHQAQYKGGARKPVKKFIAQARPADEIESFTEFAGTLVGKLKPGTVLVDDVVGKSWDRAALVQLLEMHIQENIIKVGKKYLKQKTGIPQGSVLSTILCNFFYADLERQKLSFLSEDCLLLRLIDDFLLITPDRNNATKFLQVMHDGNPAHGAFVNPDKSLVNFKATINGKKIARLVGTHEFPYCGNAVHTKTLDIRRDRERKHLANISDTLTVEFSRCPGATLLRKAISSFKVQVHAMYFDGTFNRAETVTRNIYHAFVECAMKFHRYVKALHRVKKVASTVLVACVDELLRLAYVLLRGRGGEVTRSSVRWLGAHAFAKVLKKKQTAYKPLLEWLQVAQKIRGKRPPGLWGLGLEPFKGYRY